VSFFDGRKLIDVSISHCVRGGVSIVCAVHFD
jgi:ADP-glucose pyrophosphorylase